MSSMGADHPSPSPRSSFDSTDANARKRVCKACDRCRMKKSKCDGNNPCSRCKVDNAICQFGERKKTHDKVYPKGYVEMLEQQQHQLVAGLRELYRKLLAGEGWEGLPLESALGGHPLTHDILERLNLLQQSPDSPIQLDRFEEEPERLQELLVRSGAPRVGRRPSLSPPEDSEPPSPPQSKRAPARTTSYPSPKSLYTPPRSLTPATSQLPKGMSSTQFIEPAIFEPEQQFALPTWLNAQPMVDTQMMGYDMWESPTTSLLPMNMQGFGSGLGLTTPNELSMNEFLDFSNCANPTAGR